MGLEERNVELVCLTHPGSCNGVCDMGTGECICPSGGYWVDDTSLFRYQNCALPFWYNRVVASLCLSASFFVQLYIAAYYRNKHGYAKTIIRYATITNVSVMIGCIGHLAYNGANPFFWFPMSIGIFAAASGFTTYLIAFFTLSYKTAKKNIPERQLTFIYILSVSTCSIPCFFFSFIGSVYFGIPGIPSHNPAAYNNMVAIFAATLPIQLLITGPLLIIISNRLINSMTETVKRARSLVVSSSGSPNPRISTMDASPIRDSVRQPAGPSAAQVSDSSVQAIIKRLTLFRNMMIFGAIPGEMIPCVIIALLHFLFRFQYIYVLFFILLMVLQFSVIMYVIAAGKESSKASGGSRSPSVGHGTPQPYRSSKSPHAVIASSPLRSKNGESSHGSEGKRTEEVQSESHDGSSFASVNGTRSYENLLQGSHVAINTKILPNASNQYEQDINEQIREK